MTKPGFPSSRRPPERSVARAAVGPVGYAWLVERLGLPPFVPTPAARVGPVQSLQTLDEGVMLVPARIAPEQRVLAHVLFALKHEGVNLLVLACALPAVAADELRQAIATAPNGVYLRKAGYLWERFTGQRLELPKGVVVAAPYARMFEPQAYVCGPSRREAKWRIDFNGIGDLDYCPTVRRTPELARLLETDILRQAREFAQDVPRETLDRALSWAYLSETEGSYAIEREIPSRDKAAAFARLLRHADDPREITEAYLADLQSAMITNPLGREFQFRTEQNRLQRGPGAVGITYVPPQPERARQLQHAWMRLANRWDHEQPPAPLAPLVRASILSFGLVFIHPFMDGNGRLSRFLIHRVLARSGALPGGFLLPISM
ncbi:MAG: Fic family protein, partial [Betaproteobacteria bacterium]|nr:Fic family protein [Betaproteobacteria bacterium]